MGEKIGAEGGVSPEINRSCWGAWASGAGRQISKNNQPQAGGTNPVWEMAKMCANVPIVWPVYLGMYW